MLEGPPIPTPRQRRFPSFPGEGFPIRCLPSVITRRKAASHVGSRHSFRTCPIHLWSRYSNALAWSNRKHAAILRIAGSAFLMISVQILITASVASPKSFRQAHLLCGTLFMWGGTTPCSRCRRELRIFLWQDPPATAAWPGSRCGSKEGPVTFIPTPPKIRRKHRGSCNGRCAVTSRFPISFGIHMSRSTVGPSIASSILVVHGSGSSRKMLCPWLPSSMKPWANKYAISCGCKW